MEVLSATELSSLFELNPLSDRKIVKFNATRKLFLTTKTTCDQTFSVSDMSQIYIFYHKINLNITLTIRKTQGH